MEVITVHIVAVLLAKMNKCAQKNTHTHTHTH